MENKITISIGKFPRYRVIYVCSKWFRHNEYYTIEQKTDHLLIKRCSILYVPKNAHKCCKIYGKYGHSFSITSDIPTGCYEISLEDSNEDELIIWLV